VVDSEEVEVVRRRAGERRVGGLTAAVRTDVAADFRAVEGRADDFRLAGFRTVLLAVLAGRRAVEVPPEDALRAICCTCLLKPSRRFNTLSTSALFARLRTWVWS
jgi:hypothetical protein